MKLEEGLSLVIMLLMKATELSSVIKRAREEGREDLTETELDQLALKDDAARAKLQELIDRAKTG